MTDYMGTQRFWREYEACVYMARLATSLIDKHWIERERWS